MRSSRWALKGSSLQGLASRGPYCTFTAPRRYLRTVLRDNPVSRMICRIERPCRSKTLIYTACSWVNISTAQKKPPSSPRGVKITSAGVGQFYFGADILEEIALQLILDHRFR